MKPYFTATSFDYFVLTKEADLEHQPIDPLAAIVALQTKKLPEDVETTNHYRRMLASNSAPNTKSLYGGISTQFVIVYALKRDTQEFAGTIIYLTNPQLGSVANQFTITDSNVASSTVASKLLEIRGTQALDFVTSTNGNTPINGLRFFHEVFDPTHPSVTLGDVITKRQTGYCPIKRQIMWAKQGLRTFGFRFVIPANYEGLASRSSDRLLVNYDQEMLSDYICQHLLLNNGLVHLGSTDASKNDEVKSMLDEISQKTHHRPLDRSTLFKEAQSFLEAMPSLYPETDLAAPFMNILLRHRPHIREQYPELILT